MARPKPKKSAQTKNKSSQSLSNSTQDKQVQMVVKLPESLRNAFGDACKANDRNSSQVLRDFMRKYISEHGQGKLNL